jgi:hypothetical protein
MVMADGFLRFRQQTSKDAPHGAFFISVGHFVGHLFGAWLALPGHAQNKVRAYCSPAFAIFVVSLSQMSKFLANLTTVLIVGRSAGSSS